MLLEKNNRLSQLEEQVSQHSSCLNTVSESSDFEENLYNQRILTDADWSSFKIFFVKVYPGYIQRLRNAFLTLTDAEERLFLFIKLNLTSKESAAMLGISVESVKKTRNRLRKRMDMDERVDLEGYIQGF